MTLRENYEKLRTASKAYVSAVTHRHTVHGGFWEPESNLNGPCLMADVRTADALGFEIHLQIVKGKLTMFYVAKLPTAPNVILFA